MSEINQLNSIDNISGSDLLAVWSQYNGASRKISFSSFLSWLDSQSIVTQDNKITQYSAPTTGATIQIDDGGSSVWLILTPAGTLANLTLKMPLVSGVEDKTELLVNSTQILTSLAFDANGATMVGVPSTLAANGYFRLRFDAVLDTWYRVG